MSKKKKKKEESLGSLFKEVMELSKDQIQVGLEEAKANLLFLKAGMPEMMNKGFDSKTAEEMIEGYKKNE